MEGFFAEWCADQQQEMGDKNVCQNVKSVRIHLKGRTTHHVTFEIGGFSEKSIVVLL